MKIRHSCLIVLLVAVTALQAADSWPAGLKDLVAAEKEFAATCAKVGIRDSFLMYFKDDVVTFGREMRVGKDHLRNARPADPLRFRLHWLPVYGDIARSGDMGYLTGPSLIEDSKGEQPSQQNYYFSVWTKEKDGWRVAVDFGVESRGTEFKADAPFEVAAQTRPGRMTKVASKDFGTLDKAEAGLAQKAASSGYGPAICAFAAPSIHYYRDEYAPSKGSEVCSELAKATEPRQLKSRQATVSKGGDLGYSYGDYTVGGQAPTAGSYVRVWKLSPEYGWQIVALVDKQNVK